MTYSDELIDKTKTVLQPYADKAGVNLTKEDVIESINNMCGLFELLAKLDQ